MPLLMLSLCFASPVQGPLGLVCAQRPAWPDHEQPAWLYHTYAHDPLDLALAGGPLGLQVNPACSDAPLPIYT